MHLNLNIRGVKPSPTLWINERSNQLIGEGKKVFKLGLGQSPFPIPPSVQEALKANAHQKDYLPVKGLEALREAVAGYNRKHKKIESTTEGILIGPGSKELLFLLQLVYHGELIIPSPSWVTYAPQASMLGRPVQWIPTHPSDGWRLTPQELDSACRDDPTRPRLLILNYPTNPTGATYKPEQLQELAEVARKYQLLVLSDEIYGELDFEQAHQSMALYYPEGTIVSGGLSKWCGAGGWRLGTFSFPSTLQTLLQAMVAVASETFTAVSAPIQYAAITAFRGSPAIDQYLQQSIRVLKTLGFWISKELNNAQISHPKPEGAFYSFIHFGAYEDAIRARGISDSASLCNKLLEDTGVAILPGSSFGRPKEELSARLAYVNFDGEKALQAAQKIDFDLPLTREFIERYCPAVLEGVDRLCHWVKN